MTHELDLFIIPFMNIPLAYVMGGACGGIARLLVYKGARRAEAIRSVIVGGLVAGYATESATSFAHKILDQVGYTIAGVDDLAGFALGLCGIAVAESAISLAKKWIREKSATE